MIGREQTSEQWAMRFGKASRCRLERQSTWPPVGRNPLATLASYPAEVTVTHGTDAQ
jgi:hypothetical protein